MTNLSKTKIIAGLFYIFIAFLLLAQEPKKPVLRFISQEPIEKQKRNKVQEFSSDNEKFKGIIIWGAGYIEKFILKDFDGNIIWEKDTLGPGWVWIANDGSVIMRTYVRGPTGPSVFSFYDINGNLLKRTDEYFVYTIKLLSNVGYFLVNTRRDSLLILDLKGNIIRTYGECQEYVVTARFKNLITYHENEIKFYQNGMFLGKKVGDYKYPRALVISPDENYFAFLSSKKLFLFEINNVEKLWEVNSGDNFRFISADLSFNAERVVVGLDFDAETPEKHSYGYIYVFDNEGEKLVEQRVEYKKWNIFIPGVDISDDGKFLSVKTYNEIYKYELE